MPRFEDGSINLREVLRRLAEPVVNEVTCAEADQLCEATGNGRNGYREHMLTTCVGALAPGVPKLRSGELLPRERARVLPAHRPGGVAHAEGHAVARVHSLPNAP